MPPAGYDRATVVARTLLCPRRARDRWLIFVCAGLDRGELERGPRAHRRLVPEAAAGRLAPEHVDRLLRTAGGAGPLQSSDDRRARAHGGRVGLAAFARSGSAARVGLAGRSTGTGHRRPDPFCPELLCAKAGRGPEVVVAGGPLPGRAQRAASRLYRANTLQPP